MSNLEKDKTALQQLIENETICWSEVTRMSRKDGGVRCITVELPSMLNIGISGQEKCIISGGEIGAQSNGSSLLRMMGRRIPYVIMAIDEDEDCLIGSRKRAQEILKANMLKGLANGQVYEGTLVEFGRFGAYIEVNGVTGHIRNSDFSTDHSHVREYLSIGDKVEVRCKEVSPADNYIFWESVAKYHRVVPIECDFEPDTVVLGKVVRIQRFAHGVGVFVNLKQGLDALCSVPQEIEIEEGARVSVKIEKVTPSNTPSNPPRIRGRIVATC